MTQPRNSLIDSLVADLKPVLPLRWRNGALLVAAALAVTVGIVALWQGFRTGLLTGEVAPLFVIANGLLLLLGAASATAVVAMANPQVGSGYDGPKWAMATVAILPLTAVITAMAQGAGADPLFRDHIDLHCALYGSGYSALVAATLIYWLRRGAPVSLERAGLYLGTAAGALGMFAYGLSCPLDTMSHLGIWHVLPIAGMALFGRLAVPRLLRW